MATEKIQDQFQSDAVRSHADAFSLSTSICAPPDQPMPSTPSKRAILVSVSPRLSTDDGANDTSIASAILRIEQFLATETDPKTIALLQACLKMLKTLSGDPGQVDAKLDQEVQSVLAAVSSMLGDIISTSTDPQVKAALQLFQQSLDQVQAANPAQLDAKYEKPLIDFLVKMIQLSLQVEMDMSDLTASKATNTKTTTEKAIIIVKTMGEEICLKCAELKKMIDQENEMAQGMKIISYVIAAISVLCTALTGGIMVGLAAATIAGLQVSGVMDMMFKDIDNPWLKGLAEFGFCLAVALVGAGLQAGMNAIIRNVTAAAAKAAANVGGDIEMVGMGGANGAGGLGLAAERQAAEEAIAANAARSADIAAADIAAAETGSVGSTFKSALLNLMLQGTCSTDMVSDFVTGIVGCFTNDKEKKKQLAMYLSVAITFALATGMGTLLAKTNYSGSLEMLAQGAKNSAVWSKLNTAVNFLINKIGVMMLLAVGAESVNGILLGDKQLDQGKIYKEMAPIQSAFQMMLLLLEFNRVWQKHMASDDKGVMDSLNDSHSDWLKLTDQKYAIQALQA